MATMLLSLITVGIYFASINGPMPDLAGIGICLCCVYLFSSVCVVGVMAEIGQRVIKDKLK